jgi:hypothetical protein
MSAPAVIVEGFTLAGRRPVPRHGQMAVVGYATVRYRGVRLRGCTLMVDVNGTYFAGAPSRLGHGNERQVEFAGPEAREAILPALLRAARAFMGAVTDSGVPDTPEEPQHDPGAAHSGPEP